MGFFGLFSKNNQQKGKRGRGKGRTAEEKAALRREQWLRAKRKDSPALYDEIMKRECLTPDFQPQDPLTVTVNTLSTLRGTGLLGDPTKVGGNDEWKDIAKALGIGAMSWFMQMQQGANAQTPVADPVAAANTLPPRYTQPRLPEPQLEQQEEQMSLIAQFIIGQLQNKTPLDAAHWLIDQPYPQAKQLVAQLAATPDDQLPQFLATIAQSAPDFAPLVNWLRSRPKWFVDTVHAIREIVQPQQATKGDLGL